MSRERLSLYAACVLWAGFATYYVASPLPPHNFAGDLGYNIVGFGRIAALATSPANLFDMIGWATSIDYSSFIYSPMVEYAIGLPVELVLRNPVATVKILQIVQVTLAILGAYRLYGRVFSGQWYWRAFAAAVYTLVPLNSAMFQWALGFGWIVALSPWAVVLSMDLCRRYGVRALPAAGVLCSAATFLFSSEHGVFVGLPLLALTLVLCRREGSRMSPLWMAAAFLACLLLPSYYVVTTAFGPHVMWWTKDTLSEFSGDVSNQRQMFGQGILVHLAGIYQEQMLAADAAYNVSQGAPYAAVAGVALWLLAASALFLGNVRAKIVRWWPILAVAAACIVLASGTKLPYAGAYVWDHVLARTPLLSALRTPDRFEQILGLLLALAGTAGAARLFARGGPARVFAVAGAAIVVVGYGSYALRESFLGFDDWGRLPGYAAVNDAVERIGGRTAVYAFPLDGSPLGIAAYAPRTPTVNFAWSLMQSYLHDDGGTALLRRAAVRSIVTTPSWTGASLENLPSDLADTVARSRYAGSVQRLAGVGLTPVLDPRPMLSALRTVCVRGGPAGFENAAGEPFLNAAALLHEPQTHCIRTVASDSDPLDLAIPSAAVRTWSGYELFGFVIAVPHRSFEIDRMNLTAPWFANAYQGDTLLSGTPATIDDSRPSRLVDYTISKSGPYSLYVRACGPATLEVSDAQGRTIVAQSPRTRGFTWLELPLGATGAGEHAVKLVVARYVKLAQPIVVDEVAVAPSGISVRPPQLDATLVSTREFSPSTGIDARAITYLFPRVLNVEPTAKDERVEIEGQAEVGVFSDQAMIRTADPRMRARFHWEGPSGRYIVAAAAFLAGPAAKETVTVRGQSLQARFDATKSGVPTPLFGYINLRHGDAIDVTLTRYSPGENALLQLIVCPLRAIEAPTDYDASSELWQFGPDYPIAMIAATRSDRVFVADGALRAPQGESVDIPFRPDLFGGSVIATLDFSGGSGRVHLACGNAGDEIAVGAGTGNPGNVGLVVDRTGDEACTLHVDWTSADFAVKGIDIRATGSTLRDWNATAYFSGATYRLEADDAPGLVLSVDGRPWQAGITRSVEGGRHTLTIVRGPASLRGLRFMRTGAWPLESADAIVSERSSTHWDATLAKPATLELAQMDDGNWFASGNGVAASGYACDLVNTCFDVPAGGYSVARTLPLQLVIGSVLTMLDVTGALLLLWGESKRKPAKERHE